MSSYQQREIQPNSDELFKAAFSSVLTEFGLDILKDHKRLIAILQDVANECPDERRFLLFNSDQKYFNICLSAVDCSKSMVKAVIDKASEYLQLTFMSSKQWADSISEIIIREVWDFSHKYEVSVRCPIEEYTFEEGTSVDLNYEDSRQLMKECEEKQRKNDNEKMYTLGKTLMGRMTYTDLTSAAKIFRDLKGYEDADKLEKQCTSMITERKERAKKYTREYTRIGNEYLHAKYQCEVAKEYFLVKKLAKAIEEKEAEIASLEERKKSLGLFSGKKQKRIEDQIVNIEEQIAGIEQTIENGKIRLRSYEGNTYPRDKWESATLEEMEQTLKELRSQIDSESRELEKLHGENLDIEDFARGFDDEYVKIRAAIKRIGW